MSTITSRRARWIVAAAAGISSIHALYFIQNYWIERAAVCDRTVRLEKEFAETRQKLLNHALLADQLTTMRPRLAELEQRLPTTWDTPSLEAALRDRAAQSQVAITGLHSGADVEKEFYAEKPVALRVEGKTANVFAFAEAVSHASPLRYVREMHIDSREGQGVQLQMALIYVRQSSEDK